tara:strand:- start:987 stop:1595 length:609 start_codon:yes stop_codon:yes gene_type:complete
MIEKIKQLILGNTFFYRFFQNLLIPQSYYNIYRKLSEIIQNEFDEYIVYDLGCGDAPLAEYLNKGINYVGVDMNSNHIEKAKIRYPHFRFECTSLDSLIFEERKTLIILDGVIHHLDDEQVINLLSKIALIDTHSVFCKDPVITKNQDFFSYFLMKNDGGQYVRDESKHKKILKGFNFQITDSLLRIPYKHIVSTKNIDLLL